MKIIETRVEMDIVNDSPTLIFIDESGKEWVYENHNTSQGFITRLVEKKESWYFNPENK